VLAFCASLFTATRFSIYRHGGQRVRSGSHRERSRWTKGAICAAKLRKKVAIIDRKRTIGGVCVHTGTIPSKTLREAVLYLSGFRQRSFYGRGYVLKDRIAMSDLIFRAQAVMTREIEVIKAQLRRNSGATT